MLMKIIKMYYIIKSNFTEDLYKWMKIQFLDVCTDGDIIINNLLDDLHSHNKLKNKREVIGFIPIIYDVYINNYLKGIAANPWWAN